MAKFGLAGLAKATKIMEMAEKYPIVARAMAIAKDHPVMEKIITEADEGAKAEKEAKAARTAQEFAVDAARSGVEGAAIGGTQGVVKGAARGDATKEGLAGGVGGLVGGPLGETASELAGFLAKSVGIGTSATEDAMRSFKPNKRNLEFAEKFADAAPVIDAEPSFKKATEVADKVEAIDTARENWWQRKVKPWVDKHKDAPLSGIAIHDYIEKSIPPAMERNSPEEAAKMHALADRYFPTQNPASPYQLQYKKVSIGQAEEDIEHYNALVTKTGYWSKLPKERAAMLKADGELAGNMAVANALREAMYDKLQTLEPTVDMRSLKKTYGALRNVGDELRGQINVQGRQAPTSFKQLVGLTAGIATGGWRGVVAAAVPYADRYMNSASKLAGRAVQKAARPGEEGLVAKGVGAARKGLENVTGPATSIAAQHAEESMPEKPEAENATPQGGRITYEASDKTVHSVPSDQISAALAIDPHLKIINQ